jgi:hypothetical protein
MKNLLRTLILLLLCFATCAAFGDDELYGATGVSPQAVRQGTLGSCYFHATIAALAVTQPGLLRAAIRPDAGGGFSVRFADGKVEQVYPADAQFARDSGYDRSDGLWVAVLFRGYAQRTLRAALVEAIAESSLSPILKLTMSAVVTNSDILLLAYDRAIRTQIDQAGDIDRVRLKARLRQELNSLPLEEGSKQRALGLLDSSGALGALENKIKINGELFGAYRAVGQGGLPERVMKAFAGTAHSYAIRNGAMALAAISNALEKHQAVVVWTGDDPVQIMVSKSRFPLGSQVGSWYDEEHAYSVLNVNRTAGTIRLRNPWARHPEPDGEFTLPLNSFSAACAGYITSGGGQSR